MLAIRMRRMGAKKRPFFRVVVTDSRSPRDSRFVEALGHYDPTKRPEHLDIDADRLAHWLKAGARPSDTLRTLVDRLARRPAEVPEPIAPVAKPAPVPVTAAAEPPPAAEAPAESLGVPEEAPSADAAPVETPEEPPAS